jgi:cytochrome c peroxidase
MKRWFIATPVAAFAIGLAAACGSSDNGSPPTATATPPPANLPDAGTPSPTPGGTPQQPQPMGGPPPPPPPPQTAQYVRGSLPSLYGLLPRTEYGRVKNQGQIFQDANYESTAVTTSAASKLDEVGALIGRDNGGAGSVDLMPDPADRQRSELIPFRGKPADVKLVSINNQQQLFVPLGGDVMTVGDEVAVIQVNGNNLQTLQRIQVGVRPMRIAVHPAGLVFVCNQYSNYISIIDPRTDQLLVKGSTPVEIKTEYMCADMLFTGQDIDHQDLYVANRWRHSVLHYKANIIRDAQNRPIDVIQSEVPNPQPANKPVAEILGVGNNPWRLTLNEQQTGLFVANNKGGEVARVDLSTDTAVGRVAINAPSADVVNVLDLLFVPTMTVDRGLLSNDLPVPSQVSAPPVSVQGLDNQNHVAHPGSLFDHTRSYNFEDLRNGFMQLDGLLQNNANSFYYTDNISSEPNFIQQQKVLSGALPTAVVRNGAGTLLYVAHQGSDKIQELAVNAAQRPNAVTATGRNFTTQHRPFALTLDEKNNHLFVADAGSDIVEMIDLAQGKTIATADPGFAQPTYPATPIEQGEFFFVNANWSNNGRKSCTTCHFDELDVDGVGFSNGATAPTAYHQVKPNHNLMTTNAYFWNGSFADGNYTSLAFGAQTRTNCELIEFGFIEGSGSDANARVGDANNFTTKVGNAAACRPVDGGPGLLANQAQINAQVAIERKTADAAITAATGLDKNTLAGLIDAYSVSGLKLPPNPLRRMYDAAAAGGPAQLSSQEVADIKQGHTIFQSAGCDGCHASGDTRHPFTDGLNHGSAADWVSRFVSTYQSDARITSTLGTFPETMLDALSASTPDHEVNFWYNPLEYFEPFCFDVTNCLAFDDPLAVRGESDESRRLSLLITINLQDPDRQFIPGDVIGEATVNTPSLRGVWTQSNLLHHGLAHTVREAVLAPGHSALQQGETGFAVDALGNFGVHGSTEKLSTDDVRALVRFVESIE